MAAGANGIAAPKAVPVKVARVRRRYVVDLDVAVAVDLAVAL